MLHLPYSPDLTPSDFFLFPQMKKVLKGQCFAVEEVKQTNKQNGKSTKRHQNRQAQKLFWAVEKKSLYRCIASYGEYFEGDWSLNM